MTPSRPSVRALLAKVLCADSDLDAFCGDYFEDVYARFTSGMDRVGKVNQLLDRAGTSRIVHALRRAHPDAVREHEAVLDFAPVDAVRAEPAQARDPAPAPAVVAISPTLGFGPPPVILQPRRQLREGGQLHEGDALSDGRYVLIRRVGKGGFAVVWEAYDEQRRERVAIKVLHSELAGDHIRRERFFRGARIMAELVHYAIVRVFEPHAEEGGYHYFVMELLAGGDLRAAVLARRLGGDAFLEAILRVGGALAKAHARGFIHRDIKPANILLDASGTPRLTDFDLVGGAGTTGGTRTGAIGSWIYAAPELMHRSQDADARADVYALGMTTVFGLYGADLTMDVLRDAKGFIDKLSCGETVKAVLKQAVEWEPGARFADASRFREALRRARAQARAKPPATVRAARPIATPQHQVTDDDREAQAPGKMLQSAVPEEAGREPGAGLVREAPTARIAMPPTPALRQPAASVVREAPTGNESPWMRVASWAKTRRYGRFRSMHIGIFSAF